MSREEIITAIRECAEKLGRAPSCTELSRIMQITRKHYGEHFANYTEAMREAGCETRGGGYKIELESLFVDWAQVARKLGKLPTLAEFQLHGKYSQRPLVDRFRTWREVPRGFQDFAERNGMAEEFADVVALVSEQRNCRETTRALALRECKHDLQPAGSKLLKDWPVYGPLLNLPGVRHEPTNEDGVIHLFGIMGLKLGFTVLHIQPAFPDCRALREVEPDKLQEVWIEFEFQSKNFLLHGHEWSGCDLIVCWEHNWPECPLEVIELKKEVEWMDSSSEPRASARD